MCRFCLIQIKLSQNWVEKVVFYRNIWLILRWAWWKKLKQRLFRWKTTWKLNPTIRIAVDSTIHKTENEIFSWKWTKSEQAVYVLYGRSVFSAQFIINVNEVAVAATATATATETYSTPLPKWERTLKIRQTFSNWIHVVSVV